MTSLLLYPVAILAGVAAATQGGSNGALAARAGLGSALLLNSVIVLVGSVLVFLFTGGVRQLPQVWSAPWSYYLGGVCGLIIVASISVATPRLGVATALALVVAGQGVAALVIDHLGLFGMPRATLSVSRVAGAVLLVAGMALMRR